MPAPVVREEILEPLRRTLGWLASLRDASGRIVCPAHKIEHTGKSAGAIVIACELLALDPGRDTGFLTAIAVEQGRRLVRNLVREGTSACHTFRPGRHDPFNCSNGVIDGGACSDALAHLVTSLGPELDARDRESFASASLLHARTYLRYAVLDKGIPAQRAWGLTGLAGAYALDPDAELERAAIEAVGMLEAIQNVDGSYPYHPLEWGAEHAGSSDVSAFYQSRVTGFLIHSLERMGRDPRAEIFHAPLVRGLDFLAALQAPDGTKCGLVEAKPWYWGAEYEVASHPFDVFALASGWRLFGRASYARAAQRAFRAWVEHLAPNGEPRSHHAGPGRGASYQCPVFWAAHASWLARAARDLEAIERLPAPTPAVPGAIELSVTWFPTAQLGRLEDARIQAWIRGGRPAVNVHHGSPHGAGLLRVWDKQERRDLLVRCRLGGANEAEWSALAGAPSFARGWRSGARELRFSLWLARVDWRAGRRAAALARPARVFRRGVLAFAHPRVSSAFELAPEVSVFGDGLKLGSRLAHRDGTPVETSVIERTYSIDGDGLEVRESAAAGATVRDLVYRLPGRASGVERDLARVRYRLP